MIENDLFTFEHSDLGNIDIFYRSINPDLHRVKVVKRLVELAGRLKESLDVIFGRLQTARLISILKYAKLSLQFTVTCGKDSMLASQTRNHN